MLRCDIFSPLWPGERATHEKWEEAAVAGDMPSHAQREQTSSGCSVSKGFVSRGGPAQPRREVALKPELLRAKQRGCPFGYKKLLQAPFITAVKGHARPGPAEIWLHGLHPFSAQRAARGVGCLRCHAAFSIRDGACSPASQGLEESRTLAPATLQNPGEIQLVAAAGEVPSTPGRARRDKQLAKAFAVHASFF